MLTPTFAAEYGAEPMFSEFVAVEEMFTIVAPRLLISSGSAPFTTSIAPSRFVSMLARQSAVSV